jgi:hypothetical protein
MTRTLLLSTVAVLSAVLAASPGSAQHGGAGSALPTARSQADTAEGGAADMLRRAQAALRAGQARQANELLEQAETRLLTGVEPTRPAQGDPAFHIAEARRALANRDRADAMRHTNMAIATVRDDAAAGSDAAGGSRAAMGGGPGAVDSGMGTATGRAVVRDAGSSTASVARADGPALAQSDAGAPTTRTPRPRARSAAPPPPPTGMPPGDSLPGWSVGRGSTPGAGPGGVGAASPGSGIADSVLGGNARGTGIPSGPPNVTAGPSSSSATGGEAARIGGAPPGDTSRAPGSSGIGGAGIGGSSFGGPVR